MYPVQEQKKGSRMLAEYLYKGYLIGLILGVPAGAIGAMTIKRTLTHGLKGGFASGLGSCAADLIFAMLGIFGVRIISDFLEAHEAIIEIIGGLIVIAIGITFYVRKTEIEKKEIRGDSLVMYFFTSMGTSLLNPGTMVAFMVAFTTFDINDVRGALNSGVLLFSIVAGTFTWWLALCSFVNLHRKKITEKTYKKINYILGTFVVCCGAFIIGKGVYSLL